jgi:hypothetical protein
MPSKKSSSTTASTAPSLKGSQADYEKFLPAALAIDPAAVVPMRADLQLALHNVQVGVATLAELEAQAKKLAGTKVSELLVLPNLVLATIFADTQIDRSLPPSELKAMFRRASVLRTLLLTTASSLVAAGLLSKASVDAIKRGSGAPDLARDCVSLGALYVKNAQALRGKHPVKTAEIEEASELGTKLLKAMKSGRARRKPNGAPASADVRDRLWTLVVQRHDALWRAGAYLLGRAVVDEKIPALQASRSGRAKKGKGSPA